MDNQTQNAVGNADPAVVKFENCPTCGLAWWLNPPVKCHDSNSFLCVECKAIFTGEMLAAPDMLAALQEIVQPTGYDIALALKHAREVARAAIAKATGAA